jgi:hypothetical protein
MRPLLSAITLLTLAAIPCVAQSVPRADVSAGYAYFVSTDPDGTTYNYNGGTASFAYNTNRWLAAAADVAVLYTSTDGSGNIVQTYTVGPRFSYHSAHRATPFAQALFGVARNSEYNSGSYMGSYNAFLTYLGAGADIALGDSGKFAIRPEATYFVADTHPASSAARVSFSLVYNIGELDKSTKR